jgi:hypothetical protein
VEMPLCQTEKVSDVGMTASMVKFVFHVWAHGVEKGKRGQARGRGEARSLWEMG